MLFNVVLLHLFTFFVHVVMSWGSCCLMLSYYMCSCFLFMLWCPGVHVVQCCLITCVHVFCLCCDVLKFMLFNVVLLHVIMFFVYVVMSWGSCCSMLSYYMWSRFLFMLLLSYYMCSRFLFMLWCPGFMLFNVVLLHVIMFFVHVVMSRGSCCSMLSYYMCSRFLFMLWCPGVHVVQCCLITCVHVFFSCCDVLGFMLFNVILLHVFTFFVHVVMSWGSCWWTHVIRQQWTTWTPGHHNMNKKREHM
jgi:hypothetical protein